MTHGRTMLHAGRRCARPLLLCPLLLPSGARSIARVPDDWWRDAVFYEIFVRSFADSNEGPLAGDGIGDFHGLIEKLDYLNDGDPGTHDDLGVTGVWLMPIADSPSYHGYDIIDFKKVEPDYGSNQDFQKLIDECHKRGIRVIVDTVMNHCSSESPLFLDAIAKDSPTHDWFVWRNEPLTGSGSPQQPVWHDKVRSQNGQYYYGFFWSGMPDFNLRSAAATAAIEDFSRYWLQDMNADGLRLDAIKHLIEDGVVWQNTPETLDWLRAYSRKMHAAKPAAFLVGEVWDQTPVVAQYIETGIDSAFEFSTCFAIEKGLNAGRATGIGDALEQAWNQCHGAQSTMIGNHDMDRVMSRLGGDVAKAKCAAIIQLTTPGTPFIYYGEEIGMTGAKPDPDIRTPMQWNSAEHAGFTTGKPWKAVNANADAVNVADEKDVGDSLLNTYRRLIALRQHQPPLASGDFRLLKTGDDRVLAFTRSRNNQSILVIINVSSDTIADGWRVDVTDAGARPGSAFGELLHGAAIDPPQDAHTTWRPLAMLKPYTGYIVQPHN